MKVTYIAQPDVQLGRILSSLMETKPTAKRLVLVSAFVGLQTLVRIKLAIVSLRNTGAEVRFVLGMDMGGTSQDVLREILGWDVEVLIVRHRIPGHTFHPKIYLFEWEHRAEIIIGSSNITEGGFFGNYEGCARIVYELPGDSEEYAAARTELRRFLDPSGPVVYPLTEAFLKRLIARNEIPTEAEARRNRDTGRFALLRAASGKAGKAQSPFGVETVDPPPPLPADLLEQLISKARSERRKEKRAAKVRKRKRRPSVPPIAIHAEDVLSAAAFYMTLPTLQGPNIPGEARIPLEAIELAQEFWGWPDEYKRDVSPRAGKGRIYWNWRPYWRVWSVENPGEVRSQQVRMYMYSNSSDFRFYARPLVNAGADLGDVVCIRRVAETDAEYECVLAKKGTPQYEEWIKYCTQPVQNSTRRFGYA